VIIVSDTSPINNLAAIHQLSLLQQLYSTVIIPEAVYRELTDPDFPVAGAIEVQTLDWIQTRQVSDRTVVEALTIELDIGEAEAIALALEIESDQLLIDERRGRMVANKLNLHYTGILGILVEAKNQELISEVKPLLDALRNQIEFLWISPLQILHRCILGNSSVIKILLF
jgi:predicted nucleic acid-binding protein